MSDKIAVTLELTKHEATVLRSLLSRGADWSKSEKKFGIAVEAIYTALGEVGISPTNYDFNRLAGVYPIWEKL